MDIDFVRAVHVADVGYNFSLIQREDRFKVLVSTCDKNYENEIIYNELVDVARFLRKVSVEFNVVAWFVEDESISGHATYVAFATASKDNEDLVESNGFWFHEDAC